MRYNNHIINISIYYMSNKPCNFDWSNYTGPPWSRATLVCTGNNYSQFALNMRRKAEILQYKKNQNNLTKSQQWSMLNKGLLTRKKTWATQGIVNHSNPNTNNLNLNNNTLICNTNSVEPLIIINSSSSSGVPGKSIGLYLDKSVPLTNYKNQITYSSGGKNIPEKDRYPDDYIYSVFQYGSILFKQPTQSSIAYLQYPNDIGLDTLSIGTNDFTIEWWQYWTPINDYNDVILFSIGNYLEGNIDIALTYKKKDDIFDITSSDNGGIYFWKPSINGMDNIHVVSNRLPHENMWVHFAIVGHSNEKIEFYMDGKNISTDPGPYSFMETNYPLTIGQISGSMGTDSNYFGKITNFRWLIGHKVYTSNFTPLINPLKNIQGTKLLLLSKNQSTSVKDSSNFNRIPTNHDVVYSADIPIPFVPILYSKDTIISNEYIIGEDVIKDSMSNCLYTTVINPTYYNTLFVDSKYFIENNIVNGSDKTNIEKYYGCSWDNTSHPTNNLLINWGFFYLYDITSKTFYFPLFEQLDINENVISQQTFNVFNRKFMIKYGWPVKGIYKIEINVNDDLPFKFGCYGELNSEENEIMDLSHNYVINSDNLKLYYHLDKNINSNTNKFYSYWIPKVISENNNITPYSINHHTTYMSAISKEVTRGLIVYFGFVNDINEWVINDLSVL